MTRDQFITAIAEQDQIIQQANDKMKSIKNAYIDVNKRFEIGDKIEIKSPERKATWSSGRIIPESTKTALVVGFKISWSSNNIEYILKKVKKNGECSAHLEYYNSNDILTLI